MRKIHCTLAVFAACLIAVIFVQTTHASSETTTLNTTVAVGIGSCPLFPADNAWNRDVSRDPIDPNSDNYIASINAPTMNGSNQYLRAGFGIYSEYGIPYVVVPGSQLKVPITFTHYANQSDPGPYPVPPDAPVEGMGKVAADKHVIVVDKDNCKLYEMYNASFNGTGWNASSGAVFDLRSNALRPDGWTSADAAGMPIFPGLVRYDEVATGVINHALRFSVGASQKKYIPPARHFQAQDPNPNLPPMGMRVRLKANFDISGYSSHARVILQALKTYGMFVADEGGSWHLTGTADSRWDRNSLETLRTVPGSAFEVLNTGLNIVALPSSTPTRAGTATPIPGGFNGFKVQYKPGETNIGDNQIHPDINLINQSGADVPLTQFKIRYYFTRDTVANLDSACDWAAKNCANIIVQTVVMPTPVTGADAYIEMGFTGGAGILGNTGATGYINLRTNKTDWSNFNEGNDYSFDSSKATFGDWSRITLYRNGALIWGVEPTNVVSNNPTNTVIPTTNTLVPVTATRTNTSVPPTATRLPATATRTNTPVPPTATRLPATATRTNTPVPPTATRLPATATRTNTPVPPTATRLPATATNTPVVTSPAKLKVQYRAGDLNATDDMIKPFFNLLNTGGTAIPLSEIKIRYWFTRDTAQSVSFACDWVRLNCPNITGNIVVLPTPFAGADAYVEIGFTAGAGSLGALSQTSDIQVRLNKADWSMFNERDDYSFDTTQSPDPSKIVFADWTKVTLYRNGQLEWGTEPNIPAPVSNTALSVNMVLAANTVAPTSTQTPFSTPMPTSTSVPTNTPEPPTLTPIPPSATPMPTYTSLPPTNTPEPPPLLVPTGTGG